MITALLYAQPVYTAHRSAKKSLPPPLSFTLVGMHSTRYDDVEYQI